MNKVTTIRLNEELINKLKEIANKQDRSFNYIITKLIEKGLENVWFKYNYKNLQRW